MAVDAELIKRLLAVVTGDERERLQLAVNWVAKSRDRAVKKPSAAASSDLDKAKANLEQVASSLVAIHYPDEAQPPPPSERFKNIAEAWRWVEAQGVPIKERKFRLDAKKGAYVVYPDKSVGRASVAEYLVRIKGEAQVVDLEAVDYSQAIRREQLRKLQFENKRLERQDRVEDREWVTMRDHVAQVAWLLNGLRDTLQYLCQRSAAEVTHVGGGSFELSPLVAEKMVELVVGPAFNELSRQQIAEACFAVDEEQEDGRSD